MTDPIKKRWAFLVGINEYDDPGYGNLQFCVDDVKSLGKLLATDLGFEVVCIHDNPSEVRYKPTRSAIKTELKLLCDLVGPDDLLLVHFACHGIQLDNQPCLITSEVRSYNPKGDVLPVAKIEQMMRDSGARCKVLLLDACHTGVDMGRDLADPEFIKNVYEQAEGFAFIAASTAQQKAYEIAGHGVFTHYLLNALSGSADGYPGNVITKGFVSVQDVQSYVLDNIKRWNQKTGQVQTPTARVEGFGDMILAHYPKQVQTLIETINPTSDAMTGSAAAREQTLSVAQPLSPMMERLQLSNTLNKLTPEEFEVLVNTLKPPSGIIPPSNASIGMRSSALLNWVEGATGRGLDELEGVLEQVMANQAAQSNVSKQTFPTELTSEELDEFCAALMSAFPEESDLGMMTRRGLHLRLNTVNQKAKTYEETVISLIDWAEAKGKLQILLEAAIKRNPDNHRLKAVAQKWQYL